MENISTKPNLERAIFGAGCFWGIENYFKKIDGVVNTTVGYSGGTTENPTYNQVSTGTTGHAESIEIEFDPSIVSYKELVRALFKIHDPTTKNRQGVDIGSQYRSAIFYLDNEQKKIAEKVIEDINNDFDGEIVTEVTKAGPFYPAEEYHQDYYEKQNR